MSKKVYLVEYDNSLEGDHFYYLFDSERKAFLAFDLISEEADLEDYLTPEQIEEYYSFAPSPEEEDAHWTEDNFRQYGELESFDSVKDLHAYLKKNDLELVDEISESVPYDWK